MMRKMVVWLAVAGLGLCATGCQSPRPMTGAERADQGPRTKENPAERLNIVEFYFEDELDVYYNTEQPRLGRLCMGASDIMACRVKNLRPFSRRVSAVHRGPSESSDVVGELHAVLSFHPDYDLGYRLDFRPHNGDGRGAVWLASVGDWGYGIEVPGVRVRQHWVQLFGEPLPAGSWVDVRAASFRGRVISIEGQLVSLPQVLAIFPDGVRRLTTPGSYLIERIHGAEVTFRQEVASDFPCGEDVKPPEVMPPSVRTMAANLFSDRGEPLFERTYSRGC